MKAQWDYSNNFIGLNTKIEFEEQLLHVKRVLSQDEVSTPRTTAKRGQSQNPGNGASRNMFEMPFICHVRLQVLYDDISGK